MEHAKLSPSGSKYWIVCPGAPRLCAQAPELPDEEYSAEGTKAHALAAKAVDLGVTAEDAAGDIELDMEFGDYEKPMIDNVQHFVSEVNARFEGATIKWIEYRVSLEWLAPGCWGTLDAGAYHKESKTLFVGDYKNGVQEVDVEWNPQLLHYVAGLFNEILKEYKGKSIHDYVENVVIAVVQPNGLGFDEPVKTFELTAQDVMTWLYNVLLPAASRTKDPNAPLFAGEHCRWCDAKVICPELQAQALKIGQMASINEHGKLPGPETVDPERIAKLIQFQTVFNAWAKDVKTYAQLKAREGQRIPGCKLVAGRSSRGFVPGAEDSLRKLGVHPYKETLKSPAMVEAELKEQGYRPKEAKDEIEHLVTKQQGEPVLVHESNRGKEIVVNNVQEMFNDSIFG